MRTYGEAIEVRTAPDPSDLSDLRDPSEPSGLPGLPGLSGGKVPHQFLWRGRLYVVRAVLAHWIELGTWWAGPGSRRRRPAPVGAGIGPGRGAAEAVEAVDVLEPERRSVAFDVGAVEREVWRVEARAGRSSSVGVYDLVRDVPAAAVARLEEPVPAPPVPARWRLARTLD
jgi:hypothetical protein